ncbi:hypothetical protein OEB94_25205 [Streptomyces sp. ICN988]|uniref:hypothetical protein n=2 Tax=Streptomyces TaxID=1883 RepID=UPI0021E3F48E|nr:hypothetical protein [Streptomyces sp. ICN988]MCV2462574.1 hypothetical protein [Streptomyces sp. ICN988]
MDDVRMTAAGGACGGGLEPIAGRLMLRDHRQMSTDEGRKLTRVVQTCSAYPSQWDAWTADGQYLYLRYRHGEGRVEWHPGPEDDADTPEAWNEGRSGLLTEWDDGSGSGVIGLEDFLAAAGLVLAPGASVS